MFVAGEQYERTRHQKIFFAANSSLFVPPGLDEAVAALEQAVAGDDRFAIVRTLQHLIPEYCPPPESVLTIAAPKQAAPKDANEWRLPNTHPTSQIA
jgi:hypothetical protein